MQPIHRGRKKTEEPVFYLNYLIFSETVTDSSNPTGGSLMQPTASVLHDFATAGCCCCSCGGGGGHGDGGHGNAVLCCGFLP
jgi:hypothetical protein